MKQLLIFFVITIFSICFCQFAAAQSSIVKKETLNLPLGDSIVKINVYERKGARVTFFSPHHNEQIAVRLGREAIEKTGGRFVEIESLDENGNGQRRLNFSFKGTNYSLDPNRIFTENGRQCAQFAPEIEPLVKDFAEKLLKIILADGTRLREGERFLVAIHNNRDVDESVELAQKTRDLTALSFSSGFATITLSQTEFHHQTEGVYVSNNEFDADNFVFLSTPALMSFFIAEGFSVVLQKPAAKLQIKNCTVDDGSLSVFAGVKNIPYINLEADSKYGEFRQRQMINAVYRLFFELQKNAKN
ncbi:MAG: hypothetical protein M3209_18935 [Acidobacteriota bacterium]|nr:hypothetical protein [Acidobacteriota bacterium]